MLLLHWFLNPNLLWLIGSVLEFSDTLLEDLSRVLLKGIIECFLEEIP